jgi:hypothetical protein
VDEVVEVEPHEIEIVEQNERLSRWKCSCGESNKGRWFGTAGEAFEASEEPPEIDGGTPLAILFDVAEEGVEELGSLVLASLGGVFLLAFDDGDELESGFEEAALFAH